MSANPTPNANEERFDDQLRQNLSFQPAAIPGGWEKLRAKLPPPPPPPPPPVPVIRGGGWRQFVGGLAAGALLWWGGTQGVSALKDEAVAPAPASVSVAAPVVADAPAVPGASATEAAFGAESEVESGAASAAVPASITTPSAAAPASIRSAASATPQAHAAPIFSTHGAASASHLLTTTAPGATVTIRVADSSRTTELNAVQPSASLAAGTSVRAALPLAPGWQHALALDTAIRHALGAPISPTDTSTTRSARLASLLAAQTQALTALLHEVDSLKRALPEAPPTLTAALTSSDSTSTTKTTSTTSPCADWRQLPTARSSWAVMGLLETTPSWSVLASAAPNGNQERTQAALAQSIQVQHTLGNRWLFRAGIGQATIQTQARFTSEHTTQRTYNDTTFTIDTTLHQGTRIVRAININTRDTTYFYFTSYDTLIYNTTTIWTRTITERDRLQQLLRPTYRFWTLPISAQFLFLNRNRWSLGATVGGQVTVFRGGTLPVWNGDQFVLQRVSASAGPYRPVSLSVSGGLEAQYRLTPRLSALVAPTVRWWAVPPGRNGSTTRTVLPAMQLGLTYGF